MNITPPVYLKPFSKKWWENVWYYYKWYIIGGAVALVLLVLFLTECVFRVQPDVTVSYMGGLKNMGQVAGFQLEDQLATVTRDIDSNGKGVAKVNIIYLDKNSGSEEMGAMYNMADIEMAGGDSVALLFSEDFLDRYSKYGFVDLGGSVQEFGIDESLVKRYDDGTAYAIEMRDNPLFKSLESIDTEGLYLAVRPLRPNDKSKWQKENYENGLSMARYLISGGTAMPQ